MFKYKIKINLKFLNSPMLLYVFEITLTGGNKMQKIKYVDNKTFIKNLYATSNIKTDII